MNEQVGILTIISVIITCLMSILLPIAFLLYWKKKHNAKVLPFFIGALVFIVAVLLLESILNSIIIKAFGESLQSNYILYALYGGVVAGLFEEGSRYIVMKYIMKKSLNKENAIMYGVGHGGAESILTIGLTYLSNLLFIILINTGNFELIMSSVPEEYYSQVYEQLSPLWASNFSIFLIAGFERIIAFFLQLSFSYLVYKGIAYKKPIFIFISFICHVIIDGVIAYTSLSINVYVAEIALLVLAIPLIVFTYIMYRKENQTLLKL